MKTTASFALVALLACSCGGAAMHPSPPVTESTAHSTRAIAVTPAAQVAFRPLLPDDTTGKGPAASVVFGDLSKRVPTGLLMKVPADADPGPHTHSSDYHGVVISGTLHHFTPGGGEGPALTAGSTWFAPRDVVHENHCETNEPCVLYLVFDDGFDVKPVTDKH